MPITFMHTCSQRIVDHVVETMPFATKIMQNATHFMREATGWMENAPTQAINDLMKGIFK